ncbi:MAG: potassium-transporting ATPase KdpC subunit [Acidimicrobiaceae bacterium]
MRKTFTTSAIAVVFFTLLLGIAYPLVVTGVSQVLFPGNSNGSQLKSGGKVVGSKLLAQDFKREPKYFQARPSATGWSASATFFGNQGPNQKSTRDFYRVQLKRYLALEGPYNPGLTAAAVPVDAVTDSASGVDPDISVANARIQSARVAAVRHMPLADVRALVGRYTDNRSLGLFGEPGVNVTELNLALDR